MVRDSDYFRKRAEEARAVATAKSRAQEAAVAGELALAYSALARRREAADAELLVSSEIPAGELA